MKSRNILLLIFVAFLPAAIFASSDIRTLSEDLSEYKFYAETDQMEKLVPLLKGETIGFSNFKPNQDITMFEYEVPDTVWIKNKPKKNPKEGKHYILRHKYRGTIVEDGVYYKTAKEVTPPLELVGTQFLVISVDKIEKSGYHSNPDFKVHLTNTATGDRIIWYIRSGSSSFNEGYIVHLTGLKDRLGLTGKTLYSATKGGYGEQKYSNITKYLCTDADPIIDYSSYNPKFKISFTTINENNQESTQILSLSSPTYYSSSSNLIWFDESQVSIAREADKIYEIDYTVNLNTSPDKIPFGFKSIIAVVDDTYSVNVGQKISPSKYGASEDLSPSDYINDKTIFLIGDRINVRGVDYYKGVLDGKAFYIPSSKVYLSPEGRVKVDSLVNSSPDIRDTFFEYTKALSYYSYLQTVEKAVNTIKGYSAKGISIPSWGVYDMSEYTDGTGVRFTFHNPTNKTIKYVNVSFVGYNAVDDKVGRVMSKKCIGPIDSDETAYYEFDYAWFTDIVEYAKITSLSVQYKDGSTKVVSNPASVVWSDELYNGPGANLDRLKLEVVDFE